MRGQLRIDRLFAFIALDEDGTEGLIGHYQPDGTWTPLVGADMARVDSLRPIVVDIATQTDRRITLAVFSNRDNVETFEP